MNYQPHGRRFSMNQFRAPDIDYAPVYSWVWNTRLTPETVCAQLDEFCTLGIRAIYVIQASKDFRPGFMDTDLSPDYSTPELLQIFACTLREAADRGMQMMLYGEDGGPSGEAGGRVVRGHSFSRSLSSGSVYVRPGAICDAGYRSASNFFFCLAGNAVSRPSAPKNGRSSVQPLFVSMCAQSSLHSSDFETAKDAEPLRFSSDAALRLCVWHRKY